MELIYNLFFKKLQKKFNNKSNFSLIVYFKDKQYSINGINKEKIEIYIKHKYYLFGLLIYGLPYLGKGYAKGYWTTNNLKKILEIGISNKKPI